MELSKFLGESIENLKFVSDGALQIIINDVVVDHLRQGSCIGMYSILEPTPIMFTIKAKVTLKMLVIDYDALDDLRVTHPDLDREIEKYEKYI